MSARKFTISILLAVCTLPWPSLAQMSGDEAGKTGAQIPVTPGANNKVKKNPYSENVIFDWNKYQNATEVSHPYAEKGLLRITRDRTYIYRVTESEQKTAAQLRFGIYEPKNLQAPGKDGRPPSTFADNYNQTDSPAIMLDWEWQLWQSPIGKFGVTLGGGVYVAQGNGHFAGSVNAQNGLVPRELFTFAVVPVNLGGVYRMQFWHKQLFVPYGQGGGTMFGFGEFRDDNKPPKWGGSFGAYYAAGLAMNLTYFDNLSKIALDSEYGINAVYLTAEYRGVVSFGDFDFSSDMANAGFLMEY